jgi:trans-aconitate methyltransferase
VADTKLAAFRFDAQTRADLLYVAAALGWSQTTTLKRLITQKAAQLRTAGQQPARWQAPRLGRTVDEAR